MLTFLIFAFFSGFAALVYQVVWTRQVALFLAADIEAISIVLVAFFGGLATGARIFGGRADHVKAPLRLFGGLEMAGGALALVSPFLLEWMGGMPVAALPEAARFALAGVALFPVPFLLGGTAPALTRCAVREITRSAAGAGWIVGANTAGAVLGVAAAVLAIPLLGLRASVLGAGALAVGVGAVALFRARPAPRPKRVEATPARVSPLPLAAALTAGAATLAFEVLAARAAALVLGSTLYAWGCVLALLLAGLAAGTALFGARASRARNAARDLGWIESAAALAIAAGMSWLVPDYSAPAAGVTPAALARVSLSVLPPAFLMGAAFPYFVRLAVRSLAALGRSFGTVSAYNTAGGILGALLAPFLFLPALGLPGSLLACACLNLFLGALFVVRGAPNQRAGWLRALGAALAVVLAAAPAFRPPPIMPGRRVIHLADGRQASVAVVRGAGGRSLIVDGDPEAGTTRAALETEVLLALLPIVLHPDARNFLEVGFGSGITLGTAARFPLARIECVEIAPAVISAGRFFEPENGGVVRGTDPRVRIHHDDGRAWLARHRAAYDIIVANTLHPWSVGATGLYSREYFGRVKAALRPGGIAVQWLPIARIGADAFATILRTWFAVFAEGGLWWGAENVFLVGRKVPAAGRDKALRDAPPDSLKQAGLESGPALFRRRIASARALRAALGPGDVLSDDRPALETASARRRSARPGEEIFALLEALALAGAKEDPAIEPMAAWLGARLARARGLAEAANRLERRAEAGGLALATRRRIARTADRAAAALRKGHTAEGERVLRALLAEEPTHREARYILAGIAASHGDSKSARRMLEALVRDHPAFAQAWNALGAARRADRDRAGAREAFGRAIKADPTFPEALANLGLVAAETGDYETTREMLERLRRISPGGRSPEAPSLLAVLGGP